MNGFRVELVTNERSFSLRLHIGAMYFDVIEGKNPLVLERMAEELRQEIRRAVLQ